MKILILCCSEEFLFMYIAFPVVAEKFGFKNGKLTHLHDMKKVNIKIVTKTSNVIMRSF